MGLLYYRGFAYHGRVSTNDMFLNKSLLSLFLALLLPGAGFSQIVPLDPAVPAFDAIVPVLDAAVEVADLAPAVNSLSAAIGQATLAYNEPFRDGRFNAEGIWFVREADWQFYVALDADGNGPYTRMQGGFKESVFEGRTWSGTWFQAENNREGRFKVELAEDGRSAVGEWRYTRVEERDLSSCESKSCGGRYTLLRVPPEHLPKDFQLKNPRPVLEAQIGEMANALVGRPRGDSDPYFGLTGKNDGVATGEPPIPAVYDPWEGFNRSMWKANLWVDNNLMQPFVVYVWNPIFHPTWLPGDVDIDLRPYIDNLFKNLEVPEAFLASLFQFNVKDAVFAFGRFIVNSTLGLAGLFDVAKSWFGMEPVNEDFGQMVRAWGVPPGPVLIVPMFPPSVLTETLVWMAKQPFAPLGFVLDFLPRMGVESVSRINHRSLDPMGENDPDETYSRVVEDMWKKKYRDARE